ncbi:nitric oxide synthase oxygenase [Allocoleopsis sp.]|uniref:nitric oxide synthase oxygenase n=1 Tax=Allocoleopsis sp. TaxID=3088169 RepID=UPI002FD1A79A
MHDFSYLEALPTLLLEATDYLQLFYRERPQPESHVEARLAEVYQEYRRSALRSSASLSRTYWQTPEELAYGAKVAWRNSANCIGRIFWQSLIVRDLRHLTTAREIFAALVEHIELATNNGSIRPHISIFAPQQPGKKGIRFTVSETCLD